MMQIWQWVVIFCGIMIIRNIFWDDLKDMTNIWKNTKCSNCGKKIRFKKVIRCGYRDYGFCDYKECEECSTSISSKLAKCNVCGILLCKEHIKNHECGVEKEESKMDEKIECKNCGKKVDEGDIIECYNCEGQFCEDCTLHCDECDNDFCSDCYYNEDKHDCDIGLNIIIGFKNSSDTISFNFTNKKEIEDTYARFVNSVKNKDLFIEYDDTLIIVSEIKYIDMRR